MLKQYPYLKDTAFLKTLNTLNSRETSIKLTLLNFNEQPIQEIQGIATAGSLNINGNSAVRRTASLTVVADNAQNDLTNIEFKFSINKKISIEIGVKNTTEQYKEHEYIWFPQGVFMIASSSINSSLQASTISLQLKDKMAFLNGECGGIIPAQADLANIDTEVAGELVKEPVPIYDIIKMLVVTYGDQPAAKVIIKDLENAKKVIKMATDASITVPSLAIIKNEDQNIYKTVTFTDGMDIGVMATDFTYPGELKVNAGATVMSVLDTIKKALGNYEYFFDVNGNFIFQEIKNYLNTSASSVFLNVLEQSGEASGLLPQITNNSYLLDRYRTTTVYNFDANSYISSFSNAVATNNIKNDIVVWGQKKTVGNPKPIRYHLVIDNSIEKYKQEVVKQADSTIANQDRYWVQLTEEGDLVDVVKQQATKRDYIKIIPKMWQTVCLFDNFIIANDTTERNSAGLPTSYYYSELLSSWPRMTKWSSGKDELNTKPENFDYFLDAIPTNAMISKYSVDNIGRKTAVINNDKINCLFSTLTGNYEIEIVNSEDKANFVLSDTNSKKGVLKGDEEAENKFILSYPQVIKVTQTTYDALFTAGGTQNPAFDYVKDSLYQYASYGGSVTLQTLPIYNLEPNTRVSITHPKADINGDYIIQTVSIPFDAKGMSNITCTKAIDRL